MRNHIDENIIYGELRLWKSGRKENAVGVLVEAKTDELFYRRFFTEDTAFLELMVILNYKQYLIK